MLYVFRRGIIINGIASPSSRPDFLDRSITLTLNRLEHFKSQADIDAEFEKARPALLGAPLDLLVSVLRLRPSIDSSSEFRMSDYAGFGRAVAAVRHLPPNVFDDAYRRVLSEQSLNIVESCPVTALIRVLAIDAGRANAWKGTVSQLFALILDQGERMSRKLPDRLPRSARALSTLLSELAPMLRTEDIVIERLPRTNQSRLWRIYRHDESNNELLDLACEYSTGSETVEQKPSDAERMVFDQIRMTEG